MEIQTESSVTPRPMEWGVIFAGAAVASAISIVLVQFGGMIGLSADSPLRGEGSLASWGVIATGLWLLWVQLLASLSGGYIAGFMRAPTAYLATHENEMRDGFYGLTVWAISTIGVFLVASAGAAAAMYIELNTQTDEVIDVLTDREKNAATIFAFSAATASLVCGVASWFAAVMGGHHRDQKSNFSAQFSFLRK